MKFRFVVNCLPRLKRLQFLNCIIKKLPWIWYADFPSVMMISFPALFLFRTILTFCRSSIGWRTILFVPVEAAFSHWRISFRISWKTMVSLSKLFHLEWSPELIKSHSPQFPSFKRNCARRSTQAIVDVLRSSTETAFVCATDSV